MPPQPERSGGIWPFKLGGKAVIFTIAIDGPAAAGKGTIARALARHFGFRYLDTGLLYRAVGIRASETGENPAEVALHLTDTDLTRADLRGEVAGDAASRVAVLPEVRAALIELQRRIARSSGGAVLDGRDIGTVICPQAEVKLFVTASAEVRAERRWREQGGDLATVLADVLARDKRDRERSEAPLRSAEDAVLIDTTALSIDDAVAMAIATVKTVLRQPEDGSATP